MTEYEEITTRIRREMNGAVSASMRKLSQEKQRKINFGVSIPTIKDICSSYKNNYFLAEELRRHDIREWWLAGAYIDEPDTLTTDKIEKISDGWINEEEARIYALELIAKSPIAHSISIKWINSENILRKKAAERVIAKIAPSLTEAEAINILQLTSSEEAIRAIYEFHVPLRKVINEKGPYPFSWILREIDNYI